MHLIDSHCHLKNFLEKEDLDEILSRCRDSGVYKLITVGTNSHDWECYKNLSEIYKGIIYYTIGLHPCYVTEGWINEVEQIAKFWASALKPRALGEIGLDYFRLPKNSSKASNIRSLQQKCFESQLKIAVDLGCPVVIHSRHAFDDCVSIINESGIDWSKVIFHCFSEGPKEAERLLELGGKASFTGLITYETNEVIIQSLKIMGKDNLILETDSPYLTPNPLRGKRNEPANLKCTAIKAAQILNLSLEEVSSFSVTNTIDFFGL
jgi:TatD DNase family protein